MASPTGQWLYGNEIHPKYYPSGSYWVAGWINTADTATTFSVDIWANVYFENYTGATPSYLYCWDKYFVNGDNISPASGSNGFAWENGWKYGGNPSWTYTKTHSAQNKSVEVSCKLGGDDTWSMLYLTFTVPAKASYSVKFNANGGSGAPSAVTKWYGENLTLPSTKPTRANHQFLGWSTSSTATTATYSAGGTYTANAGATLYAVWKDITPATITSESVTIASATKLNFSLTANVTCNQWQYSLDGGTWTTYSSTSGTSASGSVTVSTGTHTLQLRCRRASNSVYTTGTIFTRDTVPPTVNFTVSDIETDGFTINAISDIASDKWWYSLDNGSTWTLWSETSTTERTYTVTGLNINTAYQVKVRARKTSNGMTGDSSVQTIKTQGGIVHVDVNGQWKDAIAYVKIGSAWKQAICYTKVGSSWRINT